MADISDKQRAQAQLRQAQKMVVAPQVIDLNAVVLDGHSLLIRVIGDDIRLVLDPEPALQHTRVDPGQIEQILMSLVVNARDAIDTAPGIGTTITTYLPVCHEPLIEVPPPRQEPRTVSGTETVLLVEDDAATRELLCRTLAPQGYTVVAARDVWDALTLARSRASRIDLLLTDIVMPDMNGPQLAQHVVAMHPKIRVLYVSGFPQASALGGQARSARVSFLPKPFTPGTLLASVREALDT